MSRLPLHSAYLLRGSELETYLLSEITTLSSSVSAAIYAADTALSSSISGTITQLSSSVSSSYNAADLAYSSSLVTGFTAADTALSSSLVAQIYNAATGSGGGNTTVFDTNFITEASQDMNAGGDGTYVIDGVTWSARKTTAATSYGVVEGTGLQWEAGASYRRDFTFDEAPELSVKLEDVITNYDPGAQAYRGWFYIASSSLSNQYGEIMSGFHNFQSTALLAAMSLFNHSGFFGGGDNIGWFRRTGTSSTYEAALIDGDEGSTSGSHNVMIVTVYPDGRVSYNSGPWSSGWPSFSATKYRGNYFLNNSPSTTRFNNPGTANPQAIFLAGGSFGASSTAYAYGAVKLEYWNL